MYTHRSLTQPPPSKNGRLIRNPNQSEMIVLNERKIVVNASICFEKKIVIGLLQGVFGASQLGCLGLATSGHAMEFEPCGMNIHNQPLINCCSVKPRVERLVLIGSDSIPTCETMIFPKKIRKIKGYDWFDPFLAAVKL